jgi:hypothetical protein
LLVVVVVVMGKAVGAALVVIEQRLELHLEFPLVMS